MIRSIASLFAIPSAVVIVALITPASGSMSPLAQQCQSGKNFAAGKYYLCRQKAEAQFVRNSILDGDNSAAQGKRLESLSRCALKFGVSWARIEAHSEGLCATQGDAATIQGVVEAHTTDIAARLFLERYSQNSDGTITDRKTGLQWQAQGIGQYTYSADPDGDVPNGTAFTTLLVTLNGSTSDGVATTGCFADKCDWRVPTIDELRSLLYEQHAPGTNCSVLPCVDPPFAGPTPLMSSSWSLGGPGPWKVDPIGGNVFNGGGNEGYVRAVRGTIGGVCGPWSVP